MKEFHFKNVIYMNAVATAFILAVAECLRPMAIVEKKAVAQTHQSIARSSRNADKIKEE